MKQYLRPSTLFSTKFEGYLNQDSLEDVSKFTDWFKMFLDKYPKKTNIVSGQKEFEAFFVGKTAEEHKHIARDMYTAMNIFLKNYEMRNPNDNTFQYLPSLDKWLREDCQYWLGKVDNEC